MNIKAAFKILWLSIVDSFKGHIWKWLTGSFSALLGLLQFGKNFLNTTLETSVKIGLYFLVGLFIVRFLLFLFRNSFKYLHNLYKEVKYGEAIILLSNAFSKVHNYRKQKEKTDEDFTRTMKYLCDNVKDLFVKKNGCKCSVSIKVPVSGELVEGASVMNLVRDSENTRKRDSANYSAVDHTIIGNTAFRKSLNKVLRNNSNGFAYVNNNISKTTDYDNTSTEVYENGKLPYESEIVVPIIPKEIDENRIYNALGFLCVDCESANKFDSKYDIALVEGVADGIYDVLHSQVLNN